MLISRSLIEIGWLDDVAPISIGRVFHPSLKVRFVSPWPNLKERNDECTMHPRSRVQVGQLATRIVADSGLAVRAHALVLGDRGAAEDGRVGSRGARNVRLDRVLRRHAFGVLACEWHSLFSVLCGGPFSHSALESDRTSSPEIP